MLMKNNIPGNVNLFGLYIIHFIAFLSKGVSNKNTRISSSLKFLSFMRQCRCKTQAPIGFKMCIVKCSTIKLFIRGDIINRLQRHSIYEISGTLYYLSPKTDG